jgi:Zn-dependent membrane protease YugP
MDTTNKQLLIQKKQELVALETKIQQLPQESSGGTIGAILTLLGVLLMLLGLAGGGPLFLGGLLFLIVGIIWWISGSSSKSNRKNTIDQTNDEILKLKNEIIELENS